MRRTTLLKITSLAHSEKEEKTKQIEREEEMKEKKGKGGGEATTPPLEDPPVGTVTS
jgi:hypothetical protein